MVERRLAKANVASSNLVFRSNSKCGEKPHSWRHSQEVRQRPAKPSPPVQIWVAPPRRRKLRDHNPTLKGGIFSRFDSSSSFRKKVTTALSRKKHSLVSRSVFFASLAYQLFAGTSLRCGRLTKQQFNFSGLLQVRAKYALLRFFKKTSARL